MYGSSLIKYPRLLLPQALKLLGSVSADETAGALQLAAQVHFRLDQGQQCVEAYNKLKSSGQVRYWFGSSLHPVYMLWAVTEGAVLWFVRT